MRGMKSISSGPFDVDSTNQRHCGLLLSYLRVLRRYHWKLYLLSANNGRTGPIHGIIETRTSKLKASNGAREYLYGRMLRLILGSQSDSTPWIFRVFVHSKVVFLSTRPLYFRCVWMSSFFLYKFYGSVCTHYGRGTSNYPVTIWLPSQHEPEDCRYSFMVHSSAQTNHLLSRLTRRKRRL